MTRVDQGPPLEKDFFVRFYFERERTRKGFKYRCAFPPTRTILLLCFRLIWFFCCSVSKMSEEAASEAGAEAAAAAAT